MIDRAHDPTVEPPDGTTGQAHGHHPPAWVARSRDKVLELAPRAPGYTHALSAYDRDRRSGGGLLAGALAFRLFGAMLPLALLVAVLIGYASSLDREATASVGQGVGLGATLLDSVSESSKLSAGTRWPVAIFAAAALMSSALSAAKAIRAVHSLAWDGVVGRLQRPLKAAFVLLVALVLFAGVIALANRARDAPGLLGVVALVAVSSGGFFAIWLGLSWLLPHGDAGWEALVPGAILVAVGIQVIHLGTVLFIANKVQRASETYGALGVAFTILFWLYVVSRVIVASAMLNSELAENRRRAPAGEA